MGNICYCHDTKSYQIKAQQYSRIMSIFSLNLSQRCLNYIRQHKLQVWKHKSVDKYYFGCFHRQTADFYGVVYIPQLLYYQGHFKFGLPDGLGYLQFFDRKQKYQGQFVNGLAHGTGQLVLQCVEGQYQYRGQWRNAYPVKGKILPRFKQPKIKYIDVDKSINGISKIKFMSGDVYKGQINHLFQPDGKGIFTYNRQSSLQSYEGEWFKGKFNGSGICKWKDGSIYEGQYYNGQKHGSGKLVFASKNYYIGNWEFGYQSNFGTLYDNNNKIISCGIWSLGQFVESKEQQQNKTITCQRLPSVTEKQLLISKSKALQEQEQQF